MFECRHDYAEVQTLYKKSAEHAAEQSRLIKQLEGLHLDTQKVLRNQEEAHTADTTSYQRVHTLYTSKVITTLCCDLFPGYSITIISAISLSTIL